MKKPAIFARNQSREFQVDEMFFSTTDPRGVILAGNGVFSRISGWPAEHLIGKPHSIIRHPDMPRAAFRLVWDYLKKSRRVCALVKNLAHDGCYYWVVALLAPAEGGYLSVRFKPTSPWLEAIAKVYAAMLEEEERVLAGGADLAAAMDASTAILLAAVRAQGCADYDEFMRSLLCAELKSRDAVLAHEHRRIIPPLHAGAPAGDPPLATLHTLFRRGGELYGRLSRLFVRLDEFVALQESLESKATFVGNLTRELRLAAMNASLASSRVGSDGLSLGVVALHMGATSTDVARAVGELDQDIGRTSARLKAVVFNLAAGRLQIEMILLFLHELITGGVDGGKARATLGSIQTLLQALRQSLERAGEALGDLSLNNQRLNATAGSLGRHMLELQVAQVSGVVEATRMSESAGFSSVFGQISDLIDHARRQLSELDDSLEKLDAIAGETPAAARNLTISAREMETEARSLALA